MKIIFEPIKLRGLVVLEPLKPISANKIIKSGEVIVSYSYSSKTYITSYLEVDCAVLRLDGEVDGFKTAKKGRQTFFVKSKKQDYSCFLAYIEARVREVLTGVDMPLLTIKLEGKWD